MWVFIMTIPTCLQQSANINWGIGSSFEINHYAVNKPESIKEQWRYYYRLTQPMIFLDSSTEYNFFFSIVQVTTKVEVNHRYVKQTASLKEDSAAKIKVACWHVISLLLLRSRQVGNNKGTVKFCWLSSNAFQIAFLNTIFCYADLQTARDEVNDE